MFSWTTDIGLECFSYVSTMKNGGLVSENTDYPEPNAKKSPVMIGLSRQGIVMRLYGKMTRIPV